MTCIVGEEFSCKIGLSADPLSVYEILNADPTDRSCVRKIKGHNDIFTYVFVFVLTFLKKFEHHICLVYFIKSGKFLPEPLCKIICLIITRLNPLWLVRQQRETTLACCIFSLDTDMIFRRFSNLGQDTCFVSGVRERHRVIRCISL